MNIYMNIKKNLIDIKKDGITIIKNVLSQKNCDIYKKKCELLFQKLLKKEKVNTFSNYTQVINSPFQYDSFFFKQVFFSKLDKILTNLLDKDYVLINSNLINQKLFFHPKIKSSFAKSSEWHSDSRYFGGEKIGKGLSYIITVPLDDFTKENGGTCYVPKSHLLNKIPKRKFNYKHKLLEVKRGDLVLFDSGLWHKAGNASSNGRWSIFNYYGPWWMKPYYTYEQMLGKNRIKKLHKNIKRMLHFYCTPPKNDHKRISTVVKY